MLNQISLSIIVIDNNYAVTLNAANDDNVSKTIKMPVSITSEDGLFITNLIGKTWNFMPGAEPDALSQSKARKLQEINNQWNAIETAGWDCGQGHLGLSAEDVALLSGAFALAKEGAALGLPLPSLVTQENNQIDFATIQEMTQLMLMYGAARSQMSTEFAARRRQVAAAVTVAEVEGI